MEVLYEYEYEYEYEYMHMHMHTCSHAQSVWLLHEVYATSMRKQGQAHRAPAQLHGGG